MKNGNNKELILLELEGLRNELVEKVYSTSSTALKVILYCNYFEKVLSAKNPSFSEVFLKEFIDDYISTISKYSAFGNKPKFSVKLISQLKHISSLPVFVESLHVLNPEIERIEHQLNKLNLILNGNDYEDGINHKAFFPLIDKETSSEFYGVIESVTVRISKTTDNDKFIIVPSEKEIEKKISEQCKASWQLAVDLLKKYVRKPYQHHEVIISFDKREGFYEGNSLGIALILTFLEELLKFYNPAYVIKIKERSAFTSGIDKSGNLLNIGEELIKQKVIAVFFSEINSFVIPKLEETYAYFTLTQLKTEYPKRNLKLIPVEEIDDVLNRRDLVEVKKINPAVRTGKFVKKNWIGALVAIILTIVLSFLFVLDFDDNPNYVTADGQNVQIKNKNGRILWTKYLGIAKEFLPHQSYLHSYVILVDINSDGKNEVIVCGEQNEKTGVPIDYSMVRCYNSSGAIEWQNNFADLIVAGTDTIKEFNICLIDTLSFNGHKNLFLKGISLTSAPSPIFRINIENGRRLPGTFWASGHVKDAIIKDFDADDTSEIIGVGYDNGYEDLVFFAYEIDTLTKVRPGKENYLTKAFPKSTMKAFIRFPKTDFDIYSKVRTPGYMFLSFSDDKINKKYKFSTAIPRSNFLIGELGYELSYNFEEIEIIVCSDFRVERDTLVAHGKLNPPYTDTDEYVELQKSKILYWKDGKWVNRNYLD